MPLLFKHVCDLLSALEDLSSRDPPYLPGIKYQRHKETVSQWFSLHKITIHDPSDVIVALLSAIFPAKRTDRVYNTQRSRLISLLKRCLSLGVERQRILDQWKIPGRGDLADCVERVMRQTDDHLTLARCQVTLEEVDAALARVASKSRFSAPKVRERENDIDLQALYENIYRRLHSSEAKWLTRMILKDFSCLGIQENVVYSALDARLPVAMRMYDHFELAVIELKNLPAPQTVDTHQLVRIQRFANDAHLLFPRIGVKIGSPTWLKAKGGVKHAISIIDRRNMSVERKYDGEYCQIHIDLAKGDGCVQICSKSGKDSTIDRKGVHDAIKEGLRIGNTDCGFSEKCILLGELVVWCDKTAAVLDFHKIRKHVTRSGSFLGTEKDSQPHPWEHLMIVFYDVLLIDDDPVIHQTYEQRRLRLKRLVKRVKGRADVVWRKSVDFSKPDGPQALTAFLANAFVQRWEGLVLKPVNEPYFEPGGPRLGRYPARWLKLKKDCINGLGDTADFAVIGAGYDPKIATRLNIQNISWTHFFVACLKNKEDTLDQGARPSLFVFDCVHDCIKSADLITVNQLGGFMQMKPDSDEAFEAFQISFAKIDPAQPRMLAVFKKPFVFEVAGSGFVKPPNRDHFALRFPRVVKIHWDRDWRHSVSLNELQTMAKIARTVPLRRDSNQELTEWVRKLNQLDHGTKGKMMSWDHTDDEEEEPEGGTEDAVSAPLSSKSTRSARSYVTFPLVRIDTNEMTPNEERQSNRGVIESPASLASFVSDGSLLTLPTSPAGIDKRKRVVEHLDPTECDKNPKKARRPVLEKSKSEPTASRDKSSANLKRPLQEITNSTRPALSQRLTDIHESQQAPKAGFGLVRKLPIGVDQIVHKRHFVTKRKIIDISSQSRETTASTHTSTTLSEITVVHEAYSSSPPLREASPFRLLIPPSTNECFQPDLENCQIILSPCIASSIPEHLSRVLKELPTPIMSLPQNKTTQKIPKLAPCPGNGFQILFLVDANNTTEATASNLHKLANQLERWHPLPVHVWDWRILHFARRLNNGSARGSGDEVDDFRVARISLAPPSDHSGSKVAVQWADGGTTNELLDTFVKLERSLTK